MNTKLLIHQSIDCRIQEAENILLSLELSKTHPDVLWMDEEKLGVDQAKKIRQFLSLKPYSAKGRTVVVLNAQSFTNDAQNSLLKTLEEPPLEATILLTADSDKKILPTILSRCEVTVLDNRTQKSPSRLKGEGRGEGEIEKLLSSSIEERFEFIEKLEDKEAFFHELLNFFHEKLKSDPKSVKFTKELLHAEAWKEANGNLRAILEYLMLKLT